MGIYTEVSQEKSIRVGFELTIWHRNVNFYKTLCTSRVDTLTFEGDRKIPNDKQETLRNNSNHKLCRVFVVGLFTAEIHEKILDK